jgi:hypothetical protein
VASTKCPQPRRSGCGFVFWGCFCGFVVVGLWLWFFLWVYFWGIYLIYLCLWVCCFLCSELLPPTARGPDPERREGAAARRGGEIPAHGFEPRTFCMLSRRDNQLHHAGCAGAFTFGIVTTRSAEVQSCPLSTFQRASPAGQCHLTLPFCAGIRPPSSELVRA